MRGGGGVGVHAKHNFTMQTLARENKNTYSSIRLGGFTERVRSCISCGSLSANSGTFRKNSRCLSLLCRGGGVNNCLSSGTLSKPVMSLKLSRKVCLCSTTLRDTAQCKRTYSTLSFAPHMSILSQNRLKLAKKVDGATRTERKIGDAERFEENQCHTWKAALQATVISETMWEFNVLLQ